VKNNSNNDERICLTAMVPSLKGREHLSWFIAAMNGAAAFPAVWVL